MNSISNRNDSSNVIGFWALVSIVISSELGASIFLLPKELANYGIYGIVGWIIGGIGAILIAITFALLCSQTSAIGSSSTYVSICFGKKVGFFVNWVYWCASWACNPIIIATALDYLSPLTGVVDPISRLMMEISIVLVLTIINTQGIKTSGRVEVFLTICKILPLIIVPLCSIKFINADNIKAIRDHNYDVSTLKSILSATLLSFWGFVGLEGGTSASDFVKNPKRTIPSAIIVGTAFVTIISLVNTLSMFSVIHPEQLKTIKDPFAHVMRDIFGCSSNSSFGTSLQNFICITTFLMCIGSLNAWILFSGQIARSSANANMMP